MTISSINTNLAALFAQQNIGTATQAVQNETTALSSGNRIVNASTDVAALSTGTALQAQVNTLTTALTVASQGSSLLQVADGALAQIESIIQRQQAIATSAQSGSLSDVQRGFLNQEFQNLTQQIDQLATSTNFNGVNLINGSIAGGIDASTNANAGNATLPIVGSTNVAVVANDAFTAGDTLTVNGVIIDLKVTNGVDLSGNSTTDAAENIAAALNNSGAPQLADYRFTNSGANVEAYYIGQATSNGTIPSITTAVSSTGNHVTVPGATVAFPTGTSAFTLAAGYQTQGNDVLNINGALVTDGTTFTAGGTLAATESNLVTYLNSTQNAAWAGITFVAGAAGVVDAFYNGVNSPTLKVTDTSTAADISGAAVTVGNAPITLSTVGITGLGAGSTEAVGAINGTGLFVTYTGGSSASNFGTPVDLSGVDSNADFLGSLGGSGTIGAITANFINSGGGGVTFSVVVGNDTYTTAEITNATLSGAAPVALTFNGNNTVSGAAEGGTFTLNLQGGQATISGQAGANSLATAINTGLSTVSAYQNRNVLSYNNNFSAVTGTTETGTLQGSTLSFTSNDFSNPLVSSVSVQAPGTGQTDAKIELVVGGQTYSTVAGIGDTLATSSTFSLENLSNPSQTITLTTGATTDGTAGQAANLSTASDAAAFQTALENALGLTSANAALSFQVGTTSADSIGVSIGSATSNALFGGQSLDVNSIKDASTASSALTTALNTVISIRSTVGALEERFNYATSAATSAQQNEGAAVSNLLDTDVASESTQFATSQVQLQAGIAVLAQANQLQQNLLKLLG